MFLTRGLKKIFYVNNILRFAQVHEIRREIGNVRGAIIADIGCGDGYLINALKGRYSKYYAVEPSPMYTRIVPSENIYVLNESFENLSIPSESIDIVILSSVLQMVEKDELLLKKCADILKKDGKIWLSVPVGYTYIEKFYKKFSRYAKNSERIPNSYDEFLQKVNRTYGNSKGFYSLQELSLLLSESNLEITKATFTPGLILSLIHDISVIIKVNFGRQISTSRILLLFFPVVFLDALWFNSRGNELVVVLKKTNTCGD